MTDLICRIENTTGRMTLNRPDALNALTHEMCLEMEAVKHGRMMTRSPDCGGCQRRESVLCRRRYPASL